MKIRDPLYKLGFRFRPSPHFPIEEINRIDISVEISNEGEKTTIHYWIKEIDEDSSTSHMKRTPYTVPEEYFHSQLLPQSEVFGYPQND